VSLETDSTDNFSIISTGLIFQEEVVFEQGEIWRHGEESFTQMHKDDNLKDGVRVKVH
jgi:hypothetical protein